MATGDRQKEDFGRRRKM